MSEFHVLASVPAGAAGLPLPRPHERLSAGLGDAALKVYTDLRSGPCVIVPANDGLDETLRLMLRAGVRMAFVGDAAEGIGSVQGLITAGDLQGERPVLRALAAGVPHDDLRVADVMSAIADWPLVELAAVSKARVGDIVATLQAQGRGYLLVGECIDGQWRLRGLFSASRVGQALGTSLAEDLKSRSFAELEAALAHR